MVQSMTRSENHSEISYTLMKDILLWCYTNACGRFQYPNGASVTAHRKWSAFSCKGELQQEVVEKEEEQSANNRMEEPQERQRRPGGRQSTHPILHVYECNCVRVGSWKMQLRDWRDSTKGIMLCVPETWILALAPWPPQPLWELFLSAPKR